VSELENSFHTELAIGILLNDEKELENKLNLLTEIGLTATSSETFSLCEKFRERLVRDQEDSREWKNVSSPIGRDSDEESILQGSNENHGDE
jgi:hypothetical protein